MWILKFQRTVNILPTTVNFTNLLGTSKLICSLQISISLTSVAKTNYILRPLRNNLKIVT